MKIVLIFLIFNFIKQLKGILTICPKALKPNIVTKEVLKEKGFNYLKRLISACKTLKRSGKWLMVFKEPTPTAY